MVIRRGLRNFGIAVVACQLCLAGHQGSGAGCGSTATTASDSVAAYQAYAQSLGGYSDGEESCLNSLWQQESGWNPSAVEDQSINGNPPTYAYGIPQANPQYTGGEWGAYSESDWPSQIRWGEGYIAQTYGDPCGAWSHEQIHGWY